MLTAGSSPNPRVASRHDLRLAGYHALNRLRIEKAFRHWGHDIAGDDSPLEAATPEYKLNYAPFHPAAFGAPVHEDWSSFVTPESPARPGEEREGPENQEERAAHLASNDASCAAASAIEACMSSTRVATSASMRSR